MRKGLDEGIGLPGGKSRELRAHRSAYDAFICHVSSRDGATALAIRDSLHRLNRRPFQLRAKRIFVDRSNVAAGEISKQVLRTLEQSRFLIVLVRPELADRPWCDNELRHWRTEPGRPAPLLVLTEGSDLVWDEKESRLSFLDGERLPEELATAYESEPSWVDLRSGKEAAEQGSAAFVTEVARLAVPLHDLESVDELLGSDHRERRKLVRLRNAALAGLSVLLVAALIAAWSALRSQRTAVERLTAFFEEQGRVELLAGRPDRALPFLVAARDLGRDTAAHRLLLSRAVEPSRHLRFVLPGGLDRPVTDARWDAEESRIATCGWDGAVRVWDATDGRKLLELNEAHDGFVRGVRFSGDGQRLASWSDWEAKLWSLPSGTPISGPLHRDDLGVSAARFLPDGTLEVTGRRTVATYGRDGNLLERKQASSSAEIPGTSVSGRRELLTVKRAGQASFQLRAHDGEIHTRAVSPDGRWLATGGEDQMARVWGIDQRRASRVHTLEGHADVIWDTAWSPDAKLLATASGDQTARIWDATRGLPRQLLAGHRGSVMRVRFSANGEQLLSESMDGSARIWDIDADSLVADLSWISRVSHVRIAPNGSAIAFLGDDELTLYDLSSSESEVLPVTHWGKVRDITWVARRPLRALAVDDEGGIWIRSAATDTARDDCQLQLPLPLDGRVRFSSTGAVVLGQLRSSDGKLGWWAWGVESCGPGVKLEGTDEALFYQIEADPEAHMAVGQVHASDDGSLMLWDLKTGKRRCVLRVEEHQPAGFEVAAGRAVSFEYDAAVVVWDLSSCTGKSVAVDRPQGVSLTSDGRRLVITGVTGEVWSFSNGSWQRLFRLARRAGSRGSGGSFTADGSLIVQQLGNSARIYDGSNGRILVDQVVLPFADDIFSFLVAENGSYGLTLEGGQPRELWRLRPADPPSEEVDWAARCWTAWVLEEAVLVPQLGAVSRGCLRRPL